MTKITENEVPVNNAATNISGLDPTDTTHPLAKRLALKIIKRYGNKKCLQQQKRAHE